MTRFRPPLPAVVDRRALVVLFASFLLPRIAPATDGSRTENEATGEAARSGLRLCAENPRYLELDGKPVVLITSGEHYGAVLNLDFDYVRYLDTLARDGLRLTRTFSGAYVEPQGAFNIAQNTLAPAEGRFISPWARSDTQGYANGGAKFDLERFDPRYFERLEDFAAQAEKRGIVVELDLFCPFYGDEQWALSPMNAKNNVNGIGEIKRDEVYTLDRNGKLLAVQEKMTREIVRRLERFRNLYYEVCNEPYFGGVTDAWQRRITDVIVETEKDAPFQHLISWNIANHKAKVEKPHPAVSIFNFHYASPPETVALNRHLERVIGDNETGFRGTAPEPYRKEGWEFILAGGGLYNNLDYSFTAEHEDGTFEFPDSQPGSGGPVLRRQLRALSRFIHSFDFIRMSPQSDIARPVDEKATATVLGEPGEQYAIYIHGGARGDIAVHVPGGDYEVEWTDPISGESSGKESFSISPAGWVTIAPKRYDGEVALGVRRANRNPPR